VNRLIEILSVDEAATQLSSVTADLDLGVLRGSPVIVVDDADHLPPSVAALLADLPLVSVGIAPPGTAPTFDVLVNDAESAASVVDGVTSNPTAAVTCCQVLRNGPCQSTSTGLLLESTAYGTLQSGSEFSRWLTRREYRIRPEETEPPVLVNATDKAVQLTLNRPRTCNAWSAAMRDALVEVLRSLASPGDSRAIHLRGNGAVFCSGGDLVEFGTVEDASMGHLIRSSANAAPWLDRLSNRLTVTVHGPSVGAGVELAAFAGHIEATGDASFQLPEISMGLIPGAGGTVSLPRRIGRQKTAWLCLTGTTIDVATALNWGLIDAVSG